MKTGAPTEEMPRTAVALQESGRRPGRSVLGTPLMWQHRGLAGKLRWHLNAHLVKRLWLLNAVGARLTVVDVYGAPGDTLLTAIVCRHLRDWYPRLRLNCLTPNADLLLHDPSLDTLNEPESFFSVWSWYPDLAGRRDGKTNVLRETFARLGLERCTYDYGARVYLTPEERTFGRHLLGSVARPILTFHTRTNDPVKDWPLEGWEATLVALRRDFHVVHLGDAREPMIQDVQRLAGTLTLRESLSVLAHARVHVGADSFLMHAANGLDIPSVIVFGGSRTPANLGYDQNINLFAEMQCGPCWLQEVNGERCQYDVACMDRITPDEVIAAVRRLATGEARVKP